MPESSSASFNDDSVLVASYKNVMAGNFPRRKDMKHLSRDSGMEGLGLGKITFNIPNKSDGYMTRVQWNINSAASFLGSAITFANGSLRVLKSGYYYLYSNLVYSQEWRNTTDEFIMFCHVVYSHSPMTETKYDIILMKNCNSLCMPYKASGDCIGSSHIESVFFLRKDEEVYIKVSDPKRLYEKERDNMFGLFRI
ncbi:hypothetical protein CHS0354_009349 [Potamilus streckersoni]|uniref:THD domain-containing protein n=1 Tax=Potamilus streckersoni TaxID=2493646 RepID=A0AAE0TG04_9BIVA|nr:hypothetical protein CHS0354_009349 [Potamilus streckersoni]